MANRGTASVGTSTVTEKIHILHENPPDTLQFELSVIFYVLSEVKHLLLFYLPQHFTALSSIYCTINIFLPNFSSCLLTVSCDARIQREREKDNSLESLSQSALLSSFLDVRYKVAVGSWQSQSSLKGCANLQNLPTDGKRHACIPPTWSQLESIAPSHRQDLHAEAFSSPRGKYSSWITVLDTQTASE